MKIKAMAVIKITISCLIFFNSINTCFAADFPAEGCSLCLNMLDEKYFFTHVGFSGRPLPID